MTCLFNYLDNTSHNLLHVPGRGSYFTSVKESDGFFLFSWLGIVDKEFSSRLMYSISRDGISNLFVYLVFSHRMSSWAAIEIFPKKAPAPSSLFYSRGSPISPHNLYCTLIGHVRVKTKGQSNSDSGLKLGRELSHLTWESSNSCFL